MSHPNRRGLALAVLSAAQLMVILDGTIVNVALPSIQRDLGLSQSGLAWVVNAFLIPFGGLLLLSGRLGDLLGVRRVFIAGLTVFTAASAVGGIAGSSEVLLAARFLQGVGGALSSAVVLGMIVGLFPEPRERAKAFGLFAFVGAAGASIGVFAGGLLTETLDWHWNFLVNVPFGIAAVLLAVRTLEPDSARRERTGADVSGAVLVTSGLMLGVATILGVVEHGWLSGRTLGFGAVAVLLLAAFVGRQVVAATPLLPLRIFRSASVSGANLVQFLMVATGFTFQFVIALYLQSVLGYGALRTGLAFLPITAAIGLFSLVLSARLAARFGDRQVLLAGLSLMAVGYAWLTQLSAGGGFLVDVLPGMLLLGAGFGLAMPQLTGFAMTTDDARDAGLASGLFNTTQQLGGAVGLAVLVTLAASRTDGLLAAGSSAAAAATDGFRLTFAICVGLIVAAGLLAAATLRTGTPTAPAPATVDTPEPATR